MNRIIVGMDHSEGAAAALRWAVRESKVRAWPVTAILAYSYLDQQHLAGGIGFDPGYGHQDAVDALAAAVTNAVGQETARSIDQRAVCDLPVDALVEASAGADLLAVGARGHGGFTGLLVGSVSNRCVQSSRCPVVVVREPQAGTPGALERIVVGVDGSAGSEAALAWALDTARSHHASVDVIQAWQPPALIGMYVGTGVDLAPIEAATHQALDAAVDAADTEGVVVKRSVVCGGAAAALLDAAGAADLVVVGSRGLGRVKSLLLGSVSHQVVTHAPGPVVVVPTDH